MTEQEIRDLVVSLTTEKQEKETELEKLSDSEQEKIHELKKIFNT